MVYIAIMQVTVFRLADIESSMGKNLFKHHTFCMLQKRGGQIRRGKKIMHMFQTCTTQAKPENVSLTY